MTYVWFDDLGLTIGTGPAIVAKTRAADAITISAALVQVRARDLFAAVKSAPSLVAGAAPSACHARACTIARPVTRARTPVHGEPRTLRTCRTVVSSDTLVTLISGEARKAQAFSRTLL